VETGHGFTLTPKIPPRNDFKSKPLSAQSHSLKNREPGYHYEWASLDSEHPGYVGHKLVAQEIGDAAIGFTETPVWEVVKRPTDQSRALEEIGIRADQGKALDGTYRKGNQVLIRCREEDHENTYGLVNKLRVEAEEKRLFGGTSTAGKDPEAFTKSRVGEGSVTHKSLLEGVR